MDHDPDQEGPLGRAPTFDDLIHLCRALNEQGAKYLVIGGMAIQHHGFLRATEDMDLLVDASPGNIALMQKAMAMLPDNAASLFDSTDVDTYGVVRVSDEFMVDLLKSACGVTFEEAIKDVHIRTVQGVDIPFASPRTLLKTKQTFRSKDDLDRVFLRRILSEAP